MFNLLILPNEKQLATFKKQYPDLNEKAVLSFLMLLRVSTAMSSEIDKLLMKHGLLQNRWLILIILVREESNCSTATELSKAIGVSGATLSRLLEGLENEGLVKRTKNENDRRAQEIILTSKGIKTINKVMPEYHDFVERCFEKFSNSQHKDLMALLAIMDPAESPKAVK